MKRACDRERNNEVFLRTVLLTSNAAIIQPYFLIRLCNKRDREKRQGIRYDLIPIHVMRESCRTTHWNRHKLKDPVFVCRNHVFWVVAPFSTFRLHLQGYESVNSLAHLKTKAARICETSGRNYQTKRCQTPDKPLPQQSGGGNLKSQFSYC